MSRMLWFGLGALAGAAYASRVINTERLQNAVTESQPVDKAKSMLADYKGQAVDYKEQLADMVEKRSQTLGEVITDRGQKVAEQIRGVTFLESTEEEKTQQGTPLQSTQPSEQPL